MLKEGGGGVAEVVKIRGCEVRLGRRKEKGKEGMRRRGEGGEEEIMDD